MDNTLAPKLNEILEQIQRFPSPVAEEFKQASALMPSSLTEAQMETWARSGIEIAQRSVRSPEAAARYYQVSPAVIGHMPFNYFIKWAACGSSLCKESPALATSYFEASPATMSKIKARHIEEWCSLGARLHKGTWKSSMLACEFFASSSALLDALSFSELEQFGAFLDSLSHRSYDLSADCLVLGQRLFPIMEKDKGAFISIASVLVERGWREVKSFFEASLKALPRIHATGRLKFLKIAEGLIKSGGSNISTMMLETSQALSQLDQGYQDRILGLSESLMDISPVAVPEFVKGCPRAMEHVTMSQAEKWFEEGVRVLKQNGAGGLAFFKIESAHSEAVLEALSSGVEYDRIKNVMEMYCRALAGEEVKLATTEELVNKNIGWVSNESPSTEGSTVFVPVLVDRYSSKAENFSWFKVISTHQVAHLEFGSFYFEFGVPSTLFRDLRPELERNKIDRVKQVGDFPEADPASLEQAWVNDMQRFFNLFEDRKLALDIFTVIEDGRLDTRVKLEYPGIRRSYNQIQMDSLKDRQDIQSLPAREAMVEFLVRVSLHQYRDLLAPERYLDQARKVARISKRVLVANSTVEDVAEATLRIYAIIAQIPNEEVPSEDWEDVDTEDDQQDEYSDPEDMEQLLEQIAQGMELAFRSPEEEEYDSSQEVEYRGDFKPELAQLLTQLRMKHDKSTGESGGEPLTQEMLEELLRNSAELDLQATEGNVKNPSGMFANNLLKEAGVDLSQSPEFGQGPLVHIEEGGDALESAEPQTFVYDEWDFRANDYKPRWCIVRQKTLAEGDPNYYGMTLHNYGSLVAKVKRQFELMVPEMFRKVRKLEDGEEIDIDDVVEALIDIRTGVSPSDKLYWRRNKVQRDLAVAFLLDTSASTAEAIDEAKRTPGDWDAPDDPVEYMVWLRSRRGETLRRSYKRIIDVEKEAVVLITNALEAIGDIYGIYGFSGYGRENVEFYTIKDLDESFSDRVKRRIDRIAPLHATRMGPAIRHTTSILERQDSRTKLLFLISDGRPQDRGYSREGVEKEYAVHDTKMALDEAKRKDITAFCLTVDKSGHDYLKTMCQDIGYEVLDDIYALPERLLFLYKRLTM